MATTAIYTLSLHDALPISATAVIELGPQGEVASVRVPTMQRGSWTVPAPSSCPAADRKSTRLNSSHQIISYAVFCLKKKNYYARSVRRSVDVRRRSDVQSH